MSGSTLKLLNKVIIFVMFAHKKYSRSFIKLRMNHSCHMDYFNDVFNNFLGLKRASCIALRSIKYRMLSK